MKLNLNILRPPGPIPAESTDVPKIVKAETRAVDAEIMREDETLSVPVPEVIDPSDSERTIRNMSKLVDDNFPFDDSQREAIKGLIQEKHACLTGAAGTGKTTITKAVVDRIVDQLPHINMATYFKKDSKPQDADDDYEAPEQLIPGVALVAYTGRATQMIKKNFPRDWHGNIMTIHRLLGFYPIWEEYEDDSGQIKKKPRFIPAYDAGNKLPWKVIIIDEAGMTGLDLWNQLLDACTDDCRIIMIGDINQLPPTHGRSIFGFAMAKWPSWELTHIHRQQGVNNSIVDNAWRIINGTWPQSDDPKSLDWKFVMMPIDPDSNKASKQVRKWLDTIRGPLYDPIRDTVITPINAYEETANGYALGQDPLNRELAMMFNKEHGRYIIDAGRERKYFAIGDKVMATRNNHEAGITNGMTGVIKDIMPNGEYRENSYRYGLVEDVQKYLSDDLHIEEDMDFSLDDLSQLIDEEPVEKESKDRGPASHTVTVEFGHGDSSFEMAFGTLAEVATLMTAYVVTCHKMQGGECPFIVVICHHAHRRMLTREWLYTAVTRGSEKVVVLFTQMGMSVALGKQTIKGKNLKEKVESFNRMQDKGGLLGASVDVRLPNAETLTGSREITKTGGGATMIQQPKHEVDVAEDQPKPRILWAKPDVTNPDIRTIIIEKAIINVVEGDRSKPDVVDGGELKSESATESYDERVARERNQELDKIDQRMKMLAGNPQPTPTFLIQSTRSDPAGIDFDGLPLQDGTTMRSRRMFDWSQRFDRDFIAPSRQLMLPKPKTEQQKLREALDKHGMHNVSTGTIHETMEVGKPKVGVLNLWQLKGLRP